MFIISQSPTYSWPVQFETPADNGKRVTNSFTAVFKRMPQSEIEAIISAEGVTDRSVAKVILAGWEDIKDGAGGDLPFTTATLEQVIDVPGLSAAVVAAYLDSIQSAKRKN